MAKIDLPPPDEPPPPDIPPPEKKAEPKPKPPEPKPVQRKPQPARPAAPVDAGPAAGRARGAGRTPRRCRPRSSAAWCNPTRSIRRARARAGEQGTAMVRVLVDVDRPAGPGLAGQPRRAMPTLDQAALSAVRAAQFRPYVERGLAQAVWVLVPIKFVLQ